MKSKWAFLIILSLSGSLFSVSSFHLFWYQILATRNETSGIMGCVSSVTIFFYRHLLVPNFKILQENRKSMGRR